MPTATPPSSKPPAKPARSAKRNSSGKGSTGSASSGKAKKQTKPPTARNALDVFGIDAVCERFKAGISYSKVAAEAKVSVGAFVAWLGEDSERSARARNARSAAAAVYDEQALQGLAEATDPFELARARESAQHLRWRASKVNPREYGDRTTLTGDPEAPVQHNIVGALVLSPSEAYMRLIRGD